jgi:methyl-accepting chemotaxis protein
MLQVVYAYIKSETSRITGEVSSSLMANFNPDIIVAKNLADFGSAGIDMNSMDAVIKTFSSNLNYVTLVYYATEKSRFEEGGAFVNNLDWVPPKNFDPKTRAWYKEAVRNKGQVIFNDPYIDEMTGKLCTAISIGSFDSKGKTLGVCGIDIVLDEIAEYLKTVELYENAKIFMVDDKGNYIIHPDEEKICNPSYNFFRSSANEITREQFISSPSLSISNRKYYTSASKIGETPWYIVIEGPMSDYRDKLMRFVYIFEGILLFFSFVSAGANLRTIFKSREEDRKMGATLFEETQNLVVATKETAATSQDQSAAVKEIVATMEDSNSLSENISTKIKDVAKVATKTSSEVADGVAAVEKNVEQLHSIFDANQQTINGMKDLGDKIDSIWDIVNLINSVADQAKIIAFNAEIEATSAGEAGKKFRIVANEIRRLSDGIIDSTKEVKEKITEIQHSSDHLILASENGTEKINAGYETAKVLSNHFESIKSSSEVTAASAGEITEIIQQQTAASEQILIALKQISAGVENFTVATNNISSSADSIRILAEDLNSQNKQEEELAKRKKK